MLPPPDARRGYIPGPGGRLKEVNSLTTRLTVTLALPVKSSEHLRFVQEFNRRDWNVRPLSDGSNTGSTDNMDIDPRRHGGHVIDDLETVNEYPELRLALQSELSDENLNDY